LERHVSDEELLRQIRETPWIKDLLVQFDFDIARVANGPVEPVHLANGEALEMIAGDAAGGAFMLAGTAGDERPVVYVGSEGEGGLIARGLREALALVVGLPNIHDAVAWPISDDGGAKVRAHLTEADRYLREFRPELDADRTSLREALDLPEADVLLEALHAAAADEDYRPVSEEGDRYESMLR
jgi:hypothetical protein